MIRVAITNDEEDLLVRMPPSATVSQLKARWAEKYSVDVQDLLLTTEDGGALDDARRIESLVENSAKILHVAIREAVKVEFSVKGSDKAPTQLSIFLSTPPSTNIPKIKEKLAIEDSRPIRFSLNGAPLDSSLSFEEQQVARGCKIEVELGWRVHVKSEWTREEEMEPISCFHGDLVRPTLTSSFDGNFELFHDGKRLDFGDTISEALGITDPESQIDHTVELRIPRKIFVMDNSGVREVSVFDSTTVGELGLSCSSALMCDAEVMSSNRKLVEGAGNTLLLADLCVVVVLSHEEPRKRRRCVVRLSGRATVYDLLSKVMKIEQTRQISLYFRGRRLDDVFMELRDLGIESGSSVSCKKEPPLCIKMRTSCGNDATFSAPEVRSVTYSDLMRFHKAHDDRRDLSLAFLKGLSFRCNGCKRLISRELDGQQLVPAPCCDVASLDLTAVHHSAEKRVQTFDSRRRSVALDIQFEFEDVRDAAAQTDLLTEEASSQVELQGRDRSVVARPISEVRFGILEAIGKFSVWNIESFPWDSLSDLLERLSKKANISAKDFSYNYQVEIGAVENERLRYFTGSAERSHNEMEREEWKFVYADLEGNRCDFENSILVIHTLITGLDDVSCSPGLVPNIFMNLRCLFFELDSSTAFNLIPRNAEALSDPQYVAFIKCLRFVDTRGEMPSELVLHSISDCYVNVNSGDVFADREQTMRALRIPPQNLRDEFCFILLRQGSRLPKWPISAEFEPWINIRDGCDFSIQGGRIQRKTSMSPALSRRWVHPELNPGVPVPSDSKPHILAKQILQYISS